jgi:hypothetical protein
VNFGFAFTIVAAMGASLKPEATQWSVGSIAYPLNVCGLCATQYGGPQHLQKQSPAQTRRMHLLSATRSLWRFGETSAFGVGGHSRDFRRSLLSGQMCRSSRRIASKFFLTLPLLSSSEEDRSLETRAGFDFPLWRRRARMGIPRGSICAPLDLVLLQGTRTGPRQSCFLEIGVGRVRNIVGGHDTNIAGERRMVP